MSAEQTAMNYIEVSDAYYALRKLLREIAHAPMMNHAPKDLRERIKDAIQ